MKKTQFTSFCIGCHWQLVIMLFMKLKRLHFGKCVASSCIAFVFVCVCVFVYKESDLTRNF